MKQTSSPLPQPALEPEVSGLLDNVIADTVAMPRKIDGIVTGRLDAINADGTPTVSIAAFALAGITARSLATIDPSKIGEAVALGFEAGDPQRPVILGFMLQPAVSNPTVDATVDGERVVISAEREIELRCGDAALILSADGRIQLRGTYITSHASATQRILGGSVNFN